MSDDLLEADNIRVERIAIGDMSQEDVSFKKIVGVP